MIGTHLQNLEFLVRLTEGESRKILNTELARNNNILMYTPQQCDFCIDNIINVV